MLLTLAWATVAALAGLGMRTLRRDPTHPVTILIATGIAWAALLLCLVTHG
ncbi:MAG TPA: hypothetical protein VIS06_00035 [Mycobacteriales bacterium]